MPVPQSDIRRMGKFNSAICKFAISHNNSDVAFIVHPTGINFLHRSITEFAGIILALDGISDAILLGKDIDTLISGTGSYFNFFKTIIF